jgi:hypothetical protein
LSVLPIAQPVSHYPVYWLSINSTIFFRVSDDLFRLFNSLLQASAKVKKDIAAC